jgi:sulfate transport system ATP-binding protein
MNLGRVEQAGTPAEVFEHPANAFVMDFLGKVNFLPVDDSNGRTVLGEWVLPKAKVMTNERGESGAYLRPHELDIDRSAGGNSIKAKVMHVNPAGSVVKVRVWSEDFRLAINVDIPPDRYQVLGIRNGDTVFIFPKTQVQGPDYSI